MVYILFIGLLVLALLMQSYASCLLPSLLRCCSCLLFLCRSLLAIQLFHCVSLSAVLGFCSLFYTVHISQCMMEQLVCSVHAGIVCLTFLTCDWSQLACWDTCLASLACDQVTAYEHKGIEVRPALVNLVSNQQQQLCVKPISRQLQTIVSWTTNQVRCVLIFLIIFKC